MSCCRLPFLLLFSLMICSSGCTCSGSSGSSKGPKDSGPAKPAQDAGSKDAQSKDSGPVQDAGTDLYDGCPGPLPFDPAPGCVHPKVEKSCANGWCRIPAGCFWLGSPPDEPMHGAYEETLTPVTLTRAFEMSDHEVTQGEWVQAGFQNPSYFGPAPTGNGQCASADCPVENVNWYEAASYANRLSELHSPAYKPCYELVGCTGEPGQKMTCQDAKVTAATVYACEGYRLPTVSEWEYAARAGAKTAFYSGPISTKTYPGDCVGKDPCLEPVAWYCMDSELRTHPVRGKSPNDWGLFDMLGNVEEWTMDWFDGLGYGGSPITDPTGPEQGDQGRVLRGGCYKFWASTCRAASNFVLYPNERTETMGIRLVRTLP